MSAICPCHRNWWSKCPRTCGGKHRVDRHEEDEVTPANTISWVFQTDVPDPAIGFVLHDSNTLPHIPVTTKSLLNMDKLRELYVEIGKFLDV